MKEFAYVSRQVREEVRTICDKCDKEVDGGLGMFEVFNCELNIRSGEHYPEGDFTNLTTMDLCRPCSLELKSLLANNGYKLNDDNR